VSRESHLRSLLKGVSWRIIGTLDTLLISYFILNESSVASGIAFWDTGLKFVLYYGHERAWQNVPLGVVRQYNIFRVYSKKLIPKDYHQVVVKKESHLRSILKGVSWRLLGTLTTICIAYLFIGQITLALTIGGIEVFTKLLLYYLHERVWQRVPRGGIRKLLKKKNV